MKIKCIYLWLLTLLALAATAQPVQQTQEWEWYLDEVVSETFVGRNFFEYYYTPSAADMEQQRSRGEVTYFLNSPDGLNSKKVRDMIDRGVMTVNEGREILQLPPVPGGDVLIARGEYKNADGSSTLLSGSVKEKDFDLGGDDDIYNDTDGRGEEDKDE
jgi:hypothetical protein